MVLSTIQPDSFLVQANQILGAIEIGTFIGILLFGVSLMQGYTYFRRFPRDRRPLKTMVYLLLFLEASHSMTAAMVIYSDTVIHYLTAKPNSYPLSVNVMLETLITFLVQCFFCFRIYRLSSSSRLSIAVLCFLLSFLRLLGGLAIVVEMFIDVPNTPNGIGLAVRISWLMATALTCGAAADILIAVSMTYYLRQLASPVNFLSTATVLKRLIRFSLRELLSLFSMSSATIDLRAVGSMTETGLITSMTSVMVISCFQAMPNMIWFGFYVVLAKLYSNTLLVSSVYLFSARVISILTTFPCASLNSRPRRPDELDSGPVLDDKAPRSVLEFATNSGSKPISISFQISHREGDAFDWGLASPRKNVSVV